MNMKPESVNVPEEKIVPTESIDWRHYFFTAEDMISDVEGFDNIATLKKRFLKVCNYYEFFQDLYQTHGHNGDNKVLSDYVITNWNVFENLVRIYTDAIRLITDVYENDHDLQKMDASCPTLASEEFFIRNYLQEAKRMYKDNELNDLPEATFELLSAEQISKQEDLMNEMIGVYSKNYAEFPELLEKLISNLEESFHNDNATFVILKYQERLVGFYRLTDLGENKTHFSSFNLKAGYSSLGFGGLMMAQYLDLIAKEKIITAECDPVVPISSNYIERGFVGTSLGKIGEKGILKITRDESKTYATKNRPKEDFVTEYLQSELAGQEGVCDKGEYAIVSAPTQEKIDMTQLKEGETILTRYFKFGGKGKERWYAVFEIK